VTEPAAIKFTRHQGQGITVDEAPPQVRMDIRVLADRYAYLHMPTPDRIVFADQVVYKITGYEAGALELELLEDWRPAPTVQLPLTDEEADEIKTRWKERYGNGQAVHPVTALNQEEQP
jgi:aminoglycoside/choline kinase family phosphotransferase